MSRRSGGRLRFGIQAQMLLGLVAVFLVSGVVLYVLIDSRIAASRESQIVEDLQQIRESTGIYVRQLLIMNEANNDQESFVRLADSILQELSEAGWTDTGIYTGEGVYLAGSRIPSEELPEDFALALEGNAAYTLSYPDAEHMQVYFSMPVVVVDENLGIIRYSLDYRELFVQGRQMERMVSRVIVVVFLAAMLVIFLLLARMLDPIRRLSAVSRQVAQELADGKVNLKWADEIKQIRRRDEIGELAANYGRMLKTVDRYIRRIQRDREKIGQILDSRQEFYNNVTHELKTPLTTIQGYGQLIQDDRGRDPKLLEKGIRHILHESSRLHGMVLQLLDMADRTGMGEKEPVELRALIADVAETMQPKAKRYAFTLYFRPGEEFTVTGHADKLRQVFINLIDNAIKYGTPGTIIQIAGVKRSDSVVCAVQNQGKTLSGRELEAIFEPFYRVDKAYSREHGSAGLGLPICKKIMEEHGGTIYARSKGGLITFYLIFPRREQASLEGGEA